MIAMLQDVVVNHSIRKILMKLFIMQIIQDIVHSVKNKLKT